MLINIVATIAGGVGTVLFMFYRLQYKIDSETYGLLISVSGLGSFFSQMILVPFLSTGLGWRDTTIIIIAITANSIAFLFEALMTQHVTHALLSQYIP